jgi:hypothetical protein
MLESSGLLPALEGIFGGMSDLFGGMFGGGGTDNGSVGTVDTSEVEISTAKNLMKDMGISKNAAAGIVGNLSYESAGMTPGEKEGPPYGVSEKPWPKGTIGKGYGWAQWTNAAAGDRLDKFIDHIGGPNKIASEQDNYSFLLKELRGPEPLTNHPRGGDIPQDDPVAAADWFRKNWERAGEPADAPRRQIAKSVAQKLQTGGMVGVPTMLEPGETFGSVADFNAAIPRFGGGSNSMSGTMTPNSQNFFEKTMEMAGSDNPIVVMMGGQMGGKGQGGNSMASHPTNPAPSLSNGPSMASLSDVINRVSWSSVF